MDKKKILIGLGVLAAVGIGYYFWNKRNKPATEKEVTDDETDLNVVNMPIPIDKPETKSETEPSPASKKLTEQELESKLQSACGKKPKLRRNKKLYKECRKKTTSKLKSEGLVSFDGSYYFEGLAEIKQENINREKSFAEQVINREDGRMFAGNVYDN
jgi:hypothetical protein